MGRKAKFDGTIVPTGRGKKAKKQGDPTFPKGVLGMYLLVNYISTSTLLTLIFHKLHFIVKEENNLSHRQKQRAKKRLLKQEKLKEHVKNLKKGKQGKIEDTANVNIRFFI